MEPITITQWIGNSGDNGFIITIFLFIIFAVFVICGGYRDTMNSSITSHEAKEEIDRILKSPRSKLLSKVDPKYIKYGMK